MNIPRFPLPMGATPYVVTVADLDEALRAYYDAGHAYITASLDLRSDALALLGVMNAHRNYYHTLKGDALPEVRAAHERHRKTIAA